MDACAAPVDGHYLFAVKFRGNGPARDSQQRPVFPVEAMMRGDSEKVKVDFRVLPDGTARIDGMRFESGSKTYRRQYRRSIEAWLRSGSYRPEVLDGKAVITRISVPVAFSNDGKFKFSSRA